jgi:hypothetical protein
MADGLKYNQQISSFTVCERITAVITALLSTFKVYSHFFTSLAPFLQQRDTDV